MESINIEKTSATPSVRFEAATNTLFIAGESYPENSFDFYAPITTWIKTAVLELSELTLDMAITYMNSSSTKCALDMMDVLEDAFERGVKTSIVWRYDRENPRSYEMAEDFCEEVTFPFEIKAMNT